ncbi:nuclear export protein noc3 [Moniliophthora roreri]|uniref:Nucleolar complex-associated protein 3 n=1 Tax=Moniliophthora roreri TaxID=221103 RepID=A0A0W0F9B9_MONRR|nr:nuclear export protein noc3 [Moniliophthora roreri]
MAKRPAATSQASRKKQKRNHKPQPNPKLQKSKGKGKEKAADRPTIPIPVADGEDDVELSDQDLGLLDQSKKETERLHQLTKPARKAPVEDDLPSVDSHDEDDEEWSSGISDSEGLGDGDASLLNSSDELEPESGSDVEMPYELAPRKIRTNSKPENRGIQRLPIKLADGTIKETGRRSAEPEDESEGYQDESEDEDVVQVEPPRRDDVATGARFGRPAVLDVITTKSRKARIQAAKDQIASICQDIMAEPENSLGLIKRLHTFSLPSISTPSHSDPIPNDPLIRKLSILSQLAVFKDIVPGYRIRALTEKEKAEKVSQVVARTREWEQGLVVAYQTYLKLLEVELKARSELSETCLRCICTLLTELTHFNFRVNLMSCVVAQLSRKSRNESFDLCLSTLTTVFRSDLTGVPSLEAVRLLNRMIKERRYNVHPAALSCLLHLRLKTELGIRSSSLKADRDEGSKGKKGKGKGREEHLSKKAVKALKEQKEIEREFKEAEAVVDGEEKANNQTETLKLLFVLYFSVIKSSKRTPLLPAALDGIAKFAHLVNIDFFKDLMKVLKEIITRDNDEVEANEEGKDVANLKEPDVREKLMCIVTAFELLSGQGEALNIDLSDFIFHLYGIILPLSVISDIDSVPSGSSALPSRTDSPADALFKALYMTFLPHPSSKSSVAKTHPTWRTAAFIKRLLIASLHWPSSVIIRVLDFAHSLLARDTKLSVLLDSDDEEGRTYTGAYRPDLADPQLANALTGQGGGWYEVYALRNKHWDASVRAEAEKLIQSAATNRR